MGQKRDSGTRGAEQTVRDIRRATRRKFSAEEKIRIVSVFKVSGQMGS